MAGSEKFDAEVSKRQMTEHIVKTMWDFGISVVDIIDEATKLETVGGKRDEIRRLVEHYGFKVSA